MDFIHDSLDLIEYYMLIYGYWAVFFGVMLENAGLPIPGRDYPFGCRVLLFGGPSSDADRDVGRGRGAVLATILASP